jgi:hypothetical protein
MIWAGVLAAQTRVEPALAGADADRLFHGGDEYLAVADRPVCAAFGSASRRDPPVHRASTTSIFTFGRKSTTYSAPR